MVNVPSQPGTASTSERSRHLRLPTQSSSLSHGPVQRSSSRTLSGCVGTRLGTAEGESDCVTVGTSGSRWSDVSVGICVGTTLGTAEGESECATVGPLVGATDGPSVAEPLGGLEGVVVGLSVGKAGSSSAGS
jgi:hypothetical protein